MTWDTDGLSYLIFETKTLQFMKRNFMINHAQRLLQVNRDHASKTLSKSVRLSKPVSISVVQSSKNLPKSLPISVAFKVLLSCSFSRTVSSTVEFKN